MLDEDNILDQEFLNQFTEPEILGRSENGGFDESEKPCTVIELHYGPKQQFKRAVFECTKISYSEKTGRVNSMTFEQID